ncbi:MAG: hypothetical protein V2A75_08330 [Pseudomonadota bacterium]
MNESITKTFHWLERFFINYVWIGILLLLISIILDLHYPSTSRTYSLSIFIKSIEAIGLSVIIAAIFSFASGTSGFIEKIQSLLEDIVVRRNFLANIDPEGKKEALKSLIQPSISEKNQYPNIGNYYGYFIDKTLEIGHKNVRSNYQITSHAYFDSSKGKIAVDAMYSYRLYPSSEGYNDITIGFEQPDGGDSFCSYVAVSDPEGVRKFYEKPQLKETNNGGDIASVATIPIKDFGDSKNHLDVELKVTEFGTDHWSLIQFKALQPTDGFKFYLRCDGEVEIREHAIFVVGAKYYLDITKDKKIITISCNQWVNEGTGLCVLVSIPQKIEN